MAPTEFQTEFANPSEAFRFDTEGKLRAFRVFVNWQRTGNALSTVKFVDPDIVL